MTGPTLLDVLRTQTKVDCDSLDSEVAQQHGPFEDCTSNQAIVYHQLQEPKHEGLMRKTVQLSTELQNPKHESLMEKAPRLPKNLFETDYNKIAPAELAVEILVRQEYISNAVLYSDEPDGQLVPSNGSIHQRVHSRSDKSLFVLLHTQNN